MNTLKFKTNIKCTGCLEKVKPVLDRTVGDCSWAVDLQEVDKILSISLDENQFDEQQVINGLQQVGYKAEIMK